MEATNKWVRQTEIFIALYIFICLILISLFYGCMLHDLCDIYSLKEVQSVIRLLRMCVKYDMTFTVFFCSH